MITATEVTIQATKLPHQSLLVRHQRYSI